jgi:hypothetical protein
MPQRICGTLRAPTPIERKIPGVLRQCRPIFRSVTARYIAPHLTIAIFAIQGARLLVRMSGESTPKKVPIPPRENRPALFHYGRAFDAILVEERIESTRSAFDAVFAPNFSGFRGRPRLSIYSDPSVPNVRKRNGCRGHPLFPTCRVSP